MAINTYLSLITLSVNGLNALIKRHREVDWIKKQETHLRAKDTQIEREGIGKDTSCQWTRQESRSYSAHIRQNKLQNEGHKERQRRPEWKLLNGL